MAYTGSYFNVLEPPADYTGSAWVRGGSTDNAGAANSTFYYLTNVDVNTGDGQRLLLIPPGDYAIGSTVTMGPLNGLRVLGGGVMTSRSIGHDTNRGTTRLIWQPITGGTANPMLLMTGCDGTVFNGIAFLGTERTAVSGSFEEWTWPSLLIKIAAISGVNSNNTKFEDCAFEFADCGVLTTGSAGCDLLYFDNCAWSTMNYAVRLNNDQSLHHTFAHCSWKFINSCCVYIQNGGNARFLSPFLNQCRKFIQIGDQSYGGAGQHVAGLKIDDSNNKRRSRIYWEDEDAELGSPGTQGRNRGNISFSGITQADGQGDTYGTLSSIADNGSGKCRIQFVSPASDSDPEMLWKPGDRIIVEDTGVGSYNYSTQSYHVVESVVQDGYQRALPDSDIASGGWVCSTGSNRYALVDDYPYSDADYIRSPTGTTASITLGLSNISTYSGHTTNRLIWVRLKANGGGGSTETLKVALYQGATPLASGTVTASRADFIDKRFLLSASQSNSITDPTDLRIKMYPVSIDAAESISVSAVRFDYPNHVIKLDTDVTFTTSVSSTGSWYDGDPLFKLRGGPLLHVANSQFVKHGVVRRRLLDAESGNYAGGRGTLAVFDTCFIETDGVTDPTEATSGLFITASPSTSFGVYWKFANIFDPLKNQAPWNASNYEAQMTTADLNQLRYRLGLDGSTASPASTPGTSIPGKLASMSGALWTSSQMQQITYRLGLDGTRAAPTWGTGAQLIDVDGITFQKAYRANFASVAGKCSGVGTATEVYKGADGSTTRLTVTLDGSNNRTASTVA